MCPSGGSRRGHLETATSGLYEAKIILTRPGPEVLTSQSFIIDILPP